MGERQRIFFTAETAIGRSCIRIFAGSDSLLLHIRFNLRWVRHKVNCQKGKRESPGG